MTEPLTPQTIQANLTTQWLGRSCHVYDTLPSTNETLKEMVAAGTSQQPPAGTLVIADYQSQGKGRLNRPWQAPAGTSLLFSLLFRPNWPPEQATWLTMMAALAATEAIEAETGLPASLKWPNDVLLGSAPHWRKTGGILLAGDLAHDRLQSAVLGIGLNVNLTADQLPPAAFPPTSLLIETGRPVPRLPLLATLLGRLESHYEAARQGRSPQPAWNARLITVGQRVTAAQQPAGSPLEGLVEGTNEWGHLLLRDDNGRLHLLAAGDVSLQPNPS
jgi:BirA family transcriptional regulator, biotin operon repressor / biotin---[acetyl-CoA-carboxylase] ligase